MGINIEQRRSVFSVPRSVWFFFPPRHQFMGDAEMIQDSGDDRIDHLFDRLR